MCMTYEQLCAKHHLSDRPVFLNTQSMIDFIKVLYCIILTSLKGKVLGLTTAFTFGSESHKLAFCVNEYRVNG